MVSIGAGISLLAIFLTLPASAFAAQGDCSQPVTNGVRPTASDCLFILKVAVGSGACEPACVCDTSGESGTTATDALICLKKAVGQTVELACPCPGDTTTTSTTNTTILPPSTTTTLPPTTTSTTTTLPQTTTTTTSTTTTTIGGGGGNVLKGALPRTTGRFNYNLVVGLSGADAACDDNFHGTHSCTFAELLQAEAAGDLIGIEDTNGFTVRSFWAIDNSRPDTAQCHSVIAWDYATAHTGHFAEVADLDNDSGDLGAVDAGICAQMHWVGCCL
jgi:hypothetical protein